MDCCDGEVTAGLDAETSCSHDGSLLLFSPVRILSWSTLRDFLEQPEYADSAAPLRSWYREAEKAIWRSPMDVKSQFRSASVLRNGRVVFNIAGNKYRLVVRMDYRYSMLFVRFVGTHKQYDEIDAQEV